ncbi:MAG: symmetrical bis(5'-nucleosyl)-tetraphosphatase [Gammaproteobacteria bacterium]|nr:symmetrical bis(5'-nucleosyl)-tetraphosphatase [Gammaproteobacteria bacterium]
MAVYAIGDIQGCYRELQHLLDYLRFDPAHDRLWFAGDLVNRGPHSLETLRFVRNLGDAALTVLGNHDLHLLAAADDPARIKAGDTLHPILDATDREELLAWLRHQPLLHHDATLGFTLVHAGLPPQWDLAQAQACAHEVETVLRGADHADYFAHMYGNGPTLWAEELSGWERLRFITNCLTRLRYCDNDGHTALAFKGAPGSQPEGFLPWFSLPQRRTRDLNILFGHWSTLGPRDDPGIYPLDGGCLWGGQLTALRLDGKPQWLRIPCVGIRSPGDD